MPEGDSIYRAASALQRALAGSVITHFSSVFPALNRVDEDAPIAGRTLEKVEAHGKHLLMQLSGDLTLRTHMRMSGSWHIYRPGEAWQRPRSQMRIWLETEKFQAVAFVVHDAEWLTRGDMARSTVARLGPDILGAEFDQTLAAQRIRAEVGRPICDAILDQRVLAGIGNVYKSELLFLARVHPLAAADSIDEASALRITGDAHKLLRSNVGAAATGGIVTYRGLRRTTGRSDPAERLWVYGRSGKPCRECGSTIVMARLGQHARSTYFCPRCQVEAHKAPVRVPGLI
jgi:endonuclease-8